MKFKEGDRVEHAHARAWRSNGHDISLGTVQGVAKGWVSVVWDCAAAGDCSYYYKGKSLTLVLPERGSGGCRMNRIWMNDTVSVVNPKQVVAKDKVPLDYLEPFADQEISKAIKHGADKYGRQNFRQTEILLSVYVGAVKRHINALASGESTDGESFLSHWAHIGACAQVCLSAIEAGTYTADLPVVWQAP